MTDEPTVLVERRGRVGIATLNRPDKLNALNSQLVAELEAALRAFEADDEIGAIVLTGAGERAFSAGGDMKEQVAQLDAGQIGRRRSAAVVIRNCTKPILAAIRGYCYGGGALLATVCDIRIAADDTRFKYHGASYGQAPGGATLPRVVGAAKARELLFTGDVVEAPEALRIGLANQVVPAAEVLEYTIAMAERIAANSPGALRIIKRAIELATDNEQAQAYEDSANRDLRASSDSASRFKSAAERIVGPASG